MKTITWKQAIDIFYETHVKTMRSKAYVYNLVAITKFFEGKIFSTTTEEDIAEYRTWRLNSKTKTGKNIGKSTVNREQTVITKMFYNMYKLQKKGRYTDVLLPKQNPSTYVSRFNEKPFSRKRILTPEEFNKFLKKAPYSVKVICIFAILTCLRKKDLANLTYNNYSPYDGEFQGEQSKTGREYRVPVPKHPVIEKVLRNIQNPNAPILRPYMVNFRRLFEKARRDSGVFFEFRDLRKTGARNMLKHGADYDTVRDILGHADISMTQRYVPPSRDDKKKAQESLTEIFG